MGLINILSPTSWIGKLGLWAALFFAGYATALKTAKPCPPTTAIQIDQKNKAKKGATLTNDVAGLKSYQNCEEWLRSLKMKEVKSIRK